MPEKKRKRQDEKHSGRPSKKVALESQSDTVKVSVIEDGVEWAPVLASTPGFNLSSKICFKPYTKSRSNTSRIQEADRDVILHSSAHPKLDYTAREESTNGSENNLKHYIGVYDPERRELQLVQAREFVVRSTLRKQHKELEVNSEKDAPNALSARSNLGLAFGTKKSQKAIRALTTNAIQPSPSKPKSQPSDKTRPLDPLASAVISSMADSTSMPTREQMQASISEGKPIPKPNMQAETPAEVYPVEQLVGGVNVLRNMNVKGWIDKTNAGLDVQTRSLFLSKRLKRVVDSGDVKRLRALRYLLLLVEWFKALKVMPKGGRKVPKVEDMGAMVEEWGSETVAGIARRFADDSVLNKWHLDKLTTHILALALAVDDFDSDTHDIREDLRLDAKNITKYYHELGCAIAGPTEAEMAAIGIKKAEGPGHRIAKLRLPLVFPRMRVPTSGRKKRIEKKARLH